jgi:hypothetical protein
MSAAVRPGRRGEPAAAALGEHGVGHAPVLFARGLRDEPVALELLEHAGDARLREQDLRGEVDAAKPPPRRVVECQQHLVLAQRDAVRVAQAAVHAVGQLDVDAKEADPRGGTSLDTSSILGDSDA